METLLFLYFNFNKTPIDLTVLTTTAATQCVHSQALEDERQNPELMVVDKYVNLNDCRLRVSCLS